MQSLCSSVCNVQEKCEHVSGKFKVCFPTLPHVPIYQYHYTICLGTVRNPWILMQLHLPSRYCCCLIFGQKKRRANCDRVPPFRNGSEIPDVSRPSTWHGVRKYAIPTFFLSSPRPPQNEPQTAAKWTNFAQHQPNIAHQCPDLAPHRPNTGQRDKNRASTNEQKQVVCALLKRTWILS